MATQRKGKSSSKKLQAPEALKREENEQKQLKNLDPTNLKENIYQYKKQANELIAQVNKLNTEIATNNEKHLESSFENQTSLKREEEVMNNFRAKYQSLLKENTKQMNDLRKAWEAQKREIQQRRNKEYSEAYQRYEELVRRIEAIRVFRAKQQEYIQAIQNWKDKISQAQDSRKQELEKIEFEHAKNREKIEDDRRKQIQEIKQVEHLHAQAKLGDKQKQTKKENELLAGQIELYKLEQQQLSAQSQRLQAQIKEQKQLLLSLSVANPTQQTHERSIKILNLQEKMNHLKSYLADECKRIDDQTVNLKTYYQKEEEKLVKELKAIRASTKGKEKQAKDIKMYSQMVLDQRSSLQWYLLEVLNQSDQYQNKKSVDEVLRNLFAKVNSGVPPPSWRIQHKGSQSNLNSSLNHQMHESINEESSVEQRSQAGSHS